MTDRRGRAGSSSMISSSVIAFISSNVYPRYVNSFLRRVSTRPARFRNFLRAAFARPPIFFAMPSPPATLLLQPLRLGRHPSDLAAGRGVKAHRGRFAYMLVRPATMGMVDGIHRHAAHGEDRLAERSEGEPFLPRPVEGLVASARARDGADRRPTVRMEGAEMSRRKLNDGPVSLAHHDGLGTRGAHEATAVPGRRLDVVDERPFRDVAERHRVPAVQIRQAMGHGLADGEAVAGNHEDLLAIETNARQRSGVSGRLEDVRHDPGTAKVRIDDGPGMSVARRTVGRRIPTAAALGAQVLSHQNTPIRMPISSAENSGFNLMIACLPSLRTNVFTFATFTWKRSSKAFLTWSRVA